MTLRNSETFFRLVIGLALALGFIGFVTHTHRPSHEAPALVASAQTLLGL
ncbi:MAG: hypothetical protein JWN04_2456 [Myxococcaceae bacterium]|nr:hypothetical protein [Myxococcaceae bacterium]